MTVSKTLKEKHKAVNSITIGKTWIRGNMPRYWGPVCLDCGALILKRKSHNRFHSILSAHAWAIAILQNTHISANVHNKYDAVDRIKSRKFDSWSEDALNEVIKKHS